MIIFEWSLLPILQGIAVGFISICIFNAVYNVFFHPLKKYPGPRILAASQLPIIYAKIMGRSSHWALRLHEKYGPVVRLGPNELSYSGPESWREIYGSQPSRPAGMPRDETFYRAFDDAGAVPSLVTASKEGHSKIRRVFSRAFSENALVEQTPLIGEHVSRMLSKICEQENPINIAEMFSFVTTDIGVDLQLGAPLHLLDDTTHRPWVRNHFGLVRGITILGALAELPTVKAIFQLALPQLIKWARVLHFGWMHKMLGRRLRTKTGRPDIVHFVMNQKPLENSMSAEELQANLPIILVAQTDTVTSALNGLMACLLDAPAIHQQLKEEVRSTFPTRSDINMEAMGKMTLLNACIKEILRFYPPGAGALPRVVPKEGAIISGQWVVGGTRVYTSPLAAFRSSKNFHEPDSFHPQRWYTEPAGEFANDAREACKPFSVGTRDCLGKLMAIYLMRLLACELMMHFDMEPYTESKAWFSNQRVWTIWEQPPLMVKLTAIKPLLDAAKIEEEAEGQI